MNEFVSELPHTGASGLERREEARMKLAENELLTKVGAGTPCGEMLRRYWWPVAYADSLKNTPLPVRLLAEDLILFRKPDGAIGLLTRYCPHRGVSLEYGRVEERGLRCCYHGWLFDANGRCLEQPGEPRRPHAAQRDRRGGESALSLGQPLQRLRVHVQAEDLPHGPSERGTRRAGRIPAGHGEMDVGRIDRPAVRHLDQRDPVRRRERSQIALLLLPDVDEVGRATLQHAHGRFQMERRSPNTVSCTGSKKYTS